MEKYAQIVEMPASNVAYIFYRNLKEEKTNYDEIHILVIFNNGQQQEFKFPVGQLEMVNKRMPLVNKMVGYLKARNYDSVSRILVIDSSIVYYDKIEGLKNLSSIDTACGNIKEFIPYGFRFSKLKNGREILHIAGALMRDKRSNEFSVELDPNSTKDEIFVMNYKF